MILILLINCLSILSPTPPHRQILVVCKISTTLFKIYLQPTHNSRQGLKQKIWKEWKSLLLLYLFQNLLNKRIKKANFLLTKLKKQSKSKRLKRSRKLTKQFPKSVWSTRKSSQSMKQPKLLLLQIMQFETIIILKFTINC